MAPHHTKHHEKNTELYDYLFKYTVNVPGSVATCNDHSEFKLRSERRMPDLFLPFFLAWQFVSNQSVFSDELPGTRPTQDLVFKGGGQNPKMGLGWGGFSGQMMLFGMQI